MTAKIKSHQHEGGNGNGQEVAEDGATEKGAQVDYLATVHLTAGNGHNDP
jgi:hypothetical protein